MKIGRRIALGFAVPLGLMVVLGVGADRLAHGVVQTSQTVSHTLLVLEILETVASDLQDLETGELGYTIVGDENFLEPLRAGAADLDQALPRLREELVETSDQQRRLDRLEPLIRENLQFCESVVKLRQEAGDVAARARIATGEGKRLMDRANLAIDALEQEERSLLAQRTALAKQASATADLTLGLGTGLALLASLLIGVSLGRHITNSVRALVEGTRRLGLGERGYRLNVPSGDELGDLALKFNAMAQQIEAAAVKLEEGNQRIQLQNQELSRANRMKSEFLASMSHELRTPLNAIIGFSELLKDEVPGQLEPDQLDYAQEIYRSGRHLLSLINNILDLSRMEAGKMEVEARPIELASLVAGLLALVKERAQAGGIELSHSLADGLQEVETDASKLRQILDNLLSNAIKFTPQGGAVRLDVACHGQMVEFTVSDSGIGIDPAMIPRLFRPFEQLDSGMDRQFEGTGLGLALVKRLTELLGGTVALTSQPGRGSRFCVRIPRIASSVGKG